MDKAKAAVSSFMSKSGHHDTTVHERVAPAVINETVTPTKHENVQTAIDKEVHQDHYHTSVQPIKDKEVLPEQHHHNLAAVEHREHHHGNERDVAQRLEQEAAQFKDHSTRTQATNTQAVNPTVAGEHIHHHVHETIQPVVHKQTIEPHVVHTTVPIHEVHHNAAQHHSASALPAISMEDFKKQGGALAGREERYDGFEGEPRSIGKAIGVGHHNQGASQLASTGTGFTSGTSGVGSTGVDSTGNGLTGAGSTGHQLNSGNNLGKIDASHKKPSLMDKVNPKIDADGDGKAGFMK